MAKEKLQGDKFDEDYPTTLRLEFAKSNTKNRMKSIKELDTSQIPMFVPGKNVKIIYLKTVLNAYYLFRNS